MVCGNATYLGNANGCTTKDCSANRKERSDKVQNSLETLTHGLQGLSEVLAARLSQVPEVPVILDPIPEVPEVAVIPDSIPEVPEMAVIPAEVPHVPAFPVIPDPIPEVPEVRDGRVEQNIDNDPLGMTIKKKPASRR